MYLFSKIQTPRYNNQANLNNQVTKYKWKININLIWKKDQLNLERG
jgi:hypothetical protein